MFLLLTVCFLWFMQCDANIEKIFGGRFALNGEFPSAVAVIEENICGGTIVALDKIFTAAHCMTKAGVPRPVTNFKVYGGTTLVPVPPHFRTGREAQIRNISWFKIHEGMKDKNDKTVYHDIALLILTEPFVQTKTLSVAKYATMDEKELFDRWKAMASTKKECVGVGWGTTIFINGSPEVLSEDLKVVDLTPLDQKTCSGYTRSSDIDMTDKGEVCVSSNTAGGESSCVGDSGSPLYCDGYVFAHARAIVNCGEKTRAQYYLLHGHYFSYFGLRIDNNNTNPDVGSLLFINGRLLFMISSMIFLNNNAT